METTSWDEGDILLDVITCEDREALRYAGTIGHTVAVVATVGETRECILECNDVAFARRHMHAAGRTHVAFYHRVERPGQRWARVTP